MKHGDRLYHVKKISAKVEVVEIISSDPENEYIIQVKDLPSGTKRFIHKVFLQDWIPVEAGIQIDMFVKGLTEKYQKLYRSKLY